MSESKQGVVVDAELRRKVAERAATERIREMERLAAEIKALSPPEQLRLAAGLLEAGRVEMAHTIVDRVSVELGATLALRMLRKAAP